LTKFINSNKIHRLNHKFWLFQIKLLTNIYKYATIDLNNKFFKNQLKEEYMNSVDNLKEFNLLEKIKQLLSNLKEKERHVLIERCGLEGKTPKTLELVGKNLSLTRERVRQIEKRAFEKMQDNRSIKEKFSPIFSAITELLEKYGGVLSDEMAIVNLSKQLDQNEMPLFGYNVKFVLRVGGFSRIKKSPLVKPSWTNLKKLPRPLLDDVVSEYAGILNDRNKVVKTSDLINLFKETEIYKKNKQILNDKLLEGILYIGQPLIKVKDTDTWGHFSWPSINPKTIHDWTYYVVKKYGKPIHFTKIGDLVHNTARKKKFNVKTIHNVLIADKRFVLVGNGLYALKEWGYEPGTVLDVIKRILKKEGAPLSSHEITKRVLLERRVKPNTILVNLQNKEEFRRVKRATYTLTSRD